MDSKQQILKRFGKRVRSLREEKGMSQTDLAFSLDTSMSYISRLETGKTEPGITVLLKLASALECDPAELLKY